jgi:signal transduction histidine kinase
MASTYNNMGVAAQNIRSDYTAAADYYFKSLAMAEEVKDSVLIPTMLMNISVIQNLQKNHQKALDFASKAIKIYQAKGDQDGMAAVYEQLGNIHSSAKEWSKAEDQFARSLELYQETGHQEGLASVTAAMAIVFGNNFRKTIETRLRARALWKEINPYHLKAITNTGNLGITYLDLVRYDSNHNVRYGDVIPENRKLLLDKSAFYLSEAIRFSEQSGQTDSRTFFIGALSELEAFQGNYKDAYYHFRLFKETEDSLFSQENKNSIAIAETRREMDQKNAALAISTLELRNQQRAQWGLVSVLVLFSVIGFLLYRQASINKKNNRKLTQLNQQLDQANQLKAKFFAILSHDLRQPIARFVTLSDLQNDDPNILTAAQITHNRQDIHQSAAALLANMDDLLLWSKGQMEQFRPDIRPVQIGDIFKSIQDQVKQVKGIEFRFVVDGSFVLQTDENYLKTIMVNLTANAIKAVQQQPFAEIIWRAYTEKGNTLLSITDNGPGLSAEAKRGWMQPGQMANTKIGFGFQLIKDLAEALDCTIGVEERPDNKTIFYLNF